MRPFCVALVLLLMMTTAASAGEVFGKITSGGNPASEGTTVAAKCAAKSYPAVTTDKTGTYHIVLDETGKCTLTVTHQGKSAEVSVVSFDEAVQADLVLEIKDGKLTARRK